MPSFGIDVPAYTEQPSVGFYQELVARAERAGFSNLWVGDHLLWHRPRFETFTLLGMLAGMSRLTVGTSIALAPLRPPWWLAKQAATLERLAPGGMVLALGTGGEYPPEFERAGVDPADRGRLLDEAITHCRDAWSGRLGADVSPTPQRSVPIWVGGRRGAALRRAAERADGWLALFLTPEQFEQSRQLVERGRTRSDPFVPGIALWSAVAEDGEQARAAARETISREYEMDGARFDRYVVAGDHFSVAQRVTEYVEAGAEHIEVHAAHPDILGQIDLWGERVLPLVAGPVRADA
ncbi:LLM class flavin-dependent oxidoreductase [Micromonospora sp. NPDC005161]